jgi:hypothetical protein
MTGSHGRRFAVRFLATAVLVTGLAGTGIAWSFPEALPPFTEETVDLDGDGRFDELRLTFTANATESGLYRFSGWLIAPPDRYIARGETNWTNLAAGSHRVTLAFPGPFINLSGIDGPYTARIRAAVDAGSFTTEDEIYAHTTGVYLASAFDPPPARLVPPYADEGRDADGDGIFESLVVHAPIRVVEAANVTVDAYLNYMYGTLDAPRGDVRSYPPGDHLWDLVFDGLPLYSTRSDGPYTVSVSLSVDGLGAIDWDYHETAAYSHLQFRRPPADFRGDPTVDTTDTDADGLADFLQITVPLKVTEQGSYSVSGGVSTEQYGEEVRAYRMASLDAGNQSLDLLFSGIALNRLSSDGPWSVILGVSRVGGTDFERNYTGVETASYARTQFESRPLSYFYGSAYTPDPYPNYLQCGYAYAVDHATRFTTMSYIGYGGISLALYDGTFTVLLSACEGAIQPLLVQVTAPNDGPFRWDVQPAGPEWLNHTAELAGWNETHATSVVTTLAGHQAARFWADQAGNFDARADDLELFLQEEASRRFDAWFPLSVTVDGRAQSSLPARHTATQGAGDIMSEDPVTSSYEVDFRHRLAHVSGRSHNVTLGFAYDGYGQQHRYLVRLPEGATGNVTSTANVTIVPRSVGVWEIDPGANPDPEGPYRPPIAYIDAIAAEIPELPEDRPPPTLSAAAWIPAGVGAVSGTLGGALAYLVWRRKRQRIPPPVAAPESPPEGHGPGGGT